METLQSNLTHVTEPDEHQNAQQPKDQSRDILLIFSGNPNTCLSWIKNASIAAEKVGMAFSVLSFIHHESEAQRVLSVGGRVVNQAIYGADSIKRLGYSRKGAKQPFSLKPGNADLPVLLFFLDNPAYKRYWLFEDDVRYSGDLSTFIKEVSSIEGDLLATHLHDYIPEWTYAHTFENGNEKLTNQDKWLCFLPFFRISNYALKVIHESYTNGYAGHHEIAWPTILKHYDVKVVDIGGNGKHVSASLINKYYLGRPNDRYEKNGTFGVNQQYIRAGKVIDKLWHPVRPPMKFASIAFKRPYVILKWYAHRLNREITDRFRSWLS